MFRLFVDINQCRHIYFAGCHDTGFCSLLTPYRGRGDRITLIKGASFHREFEELNLPIRELPSVFMSIPLATTKPTATFTATKAAPATNGTKPVVCKHWQKVRVSCYDRFRPAAHLLPGDLQIWQRLHQTAHNAQPAAVPDNRRSPQVTVGHFSCPRSF